MSDADKLTHLGRSVWNLRDCLFNEIEFLQSGKSTPQRAQAIAKLAAQIIESAKVEVNHGKALQAAIESKVLLTDGAPLSSVLKKDEKTGPREGYDV